MNETLEQKIKKLHKNFKPKNKIWHRIVRACNPKFMKKYYAVIGNNFGVVFPDFDGCVSMGKDLSNAINMAQITLEFYVKGMREGGEELPEPKTLEQVKKEYPDNVFKYQPIFIK
jgi:predicted RNase H-like HicB family nuclease